MSSPRGEFGRIFHATDLTVGSEAAFDHALRLAVAARGHLYIVHAQHRSQRNETAWAAFPGVRSSMIRWGLLPIGAAPADVRERAGVQVTKVEVHDRNPIDGVVRFMNEHPGDLLVVATHARKGFSYVFRGSVAETIARGTVVPTLFLPSGCQGFVDHKAGTPRLRNMLFPDARHCTPGEIASTAFRFADQLNCTDALLHVLRVGPAEDYPSLVEGAAHESRLRTVHVQGAFVDAVMTQAESLRADLIVMPMVRRGGVLDHFRGSMTEQVLHRVGRPLLAVPTR